MAQTTAQQSPLVQEDTIAAIATGQGVGGIGIVRLSGKTAVAVADRVFVSKSGKRIADLAGYTALYGTVHQGEALLDEAIALRFAAPCSYTGEDVVELSCHGGLFVVQSILQAVLQAGARLAEPGEFTRRAFLNGKISLTKAESIMALISASGKESAAMALAEQDGKLSHKIEALTATLVESAAHLSAWADYPEEDLPQLSREVLTASLQNVATALATMLQEFDQGKVVREGVETAILGRPNVGKSTLMNLLSGHERSIVTEYAGTTRDVVEETIHLGNVTLHLADTAGIRHTEDPVEQLGVQLSHKRLETSQLALVMLDGSSPLTEEDRALLCAAKDRQTIVILNKTDVAQVVTEADLADFGLPVVAISAKDGAGVQALTKAVEETLHTAKLEPDSGILFTQRQQAVAQRALEAVQEALDALALGMTLDAVTVSLEDGIGALLELSGKRVTDTVVDAVFAKFCVGK